MNFVHDVCFIFEFNNGVIKFKIVHSNAIFICEGGIKGNFDAFLNIRREKLIRPNRSWEPVVFGGRSCSGSGEGQDVVAFKLANDHHVGIE